MKQKKITIIISYDYGEKNTICNDMMKNALLLLRKWLRNLLEKNIISTWKYVEVLEDRDEGPNDSGTWDEYEDALNDGLLKACKIIIDKK